MSSMDEGQTLTIKVQSDLRATCGTLVPGLQNNRVTIRAGMKTNRTRTNKIPRAGTKNPNSN